MSELSRDELLRASQLTTGDSHLVGRGSEIYRESMRALWDRGMPSGAKTGWRGVDRFYTVAPGQVTVLTGWPGSGKSEWLDALLLALARQGWRFALFSPENQPTELHIAKFLEKFSGKPFGAGPTERMTPEEVDEAITEIDEWFRFITPTFSTDKLSFTIEEVLKAAECEFLLRGLWKRERENQLGLVIDPWNELEHLRPAALSETEYVSQTLSMIRAWARKNAVHVWIVAHPQKLKRLENGKLPIPTPDTISGSQHWWNKADCCLTIFREFAEKQSPTVEVHVQKIRFKNIGRIGLATLEYDRTTGRYYEKPINFSVVAG